MNPRHIEFPTFPGPPVRVDENGDGSIEEWCLDSTGRGKRVLSRNEEGSEDRYFFDGKISRLDGPAWTTLRSDGSKSDEGWWRDGVFHRIDGPAIVVYDEVGKVQSEEWWLCGDPADDLTEVAAEITAKWCPERIETEVGYSSFAHFLEEGYTGPAIMAALAAGVSPVEGLRRVLEGTPAEWVVAFESGSTTGVSAV